MWIRTVQEVERAFAFANAARRYWFSVFPLARRELRRWRNRAAEIPDPVLRAHALVTHQGKSTHSEGAAAFAALAPRAQRKPVIRALVAFQAMYDYLDTVSEQPGSDPFGNGCQLHSALLVALDPSAPRVDYYARNPQTDDGGYLQAHIDVCRSACQALPAYPVVEGPVRRAAYRCMVSQGFNHALSSTSRSARTDVIAGWAQGTLPPGSGLRWWELLGAAGSSLTIYALIAAAADPALDRSGVKKVERLYFPWAGALHGLLDSLIDQVQDAANGDHSHVARYRSPVEAAERLGAIASRAFSLAEKVPLGRYHAVILVGMGSYYLSRPEATVALAREATDRVLAEAGFLAKPALAVLYLRRRAGLALGWDA